VLQSSLEIKLIHFENSLIIHEENKKEHFDIEKEIQNVCIHFENRLIVHQENKKEPLDIEKKIPNVCIFFFSYGTLAYH